MINVNELLWISVNQGEPAALDLDHEAVTFLKNVSHIGQGILNRL